MLTCGKVWPWQLESVCIHPLVAHGLNYSFTSTVWQFYIIIYSIFCLSSRRNETAIRDTTRICASLGLRMKFKTLFMSDYSAVNLQNLGTLGVEQFPNRTSNHFFLISIFLSSESASNFLSEPKSDKVTPNNETNDHIFCRK